MIVLKEILKEIYEARLNNLRSKMAAAEVESLLIMRPENIRYVSGFSGEGVLLVTHAEAVLITDGRFVEQSRLESPAWRLVLAAKSYLESLGAVASGRIQELAIEDDYITYRQFQQVQEKLPTVRLRSAGGMVEQLRLIKDRWELEQIRQAGVITGAALMHLLGDLHDGMTESEAAGIMEHFMRSNGGGLPAFETIVASGERGALPHGMATGKKIRQGELIVFDLGATYNGYAADLTRTVCLGSFQPKQRDLYELVREAQEKALSGVKAGVTVGEVDALARQVIEAAGYGKNFNHNLGHGVGLAIHEEPRLSPGGSLVLQPGMVITVEPGLYLAGWGGIRIEDTVLVTEQGYEVLTPVKKEFIVV